MRQGLGFLASAEEPEWVFSPDPCASLTSVLAGTSRDISIWSLVHEHCQSLVSSSSELRILKSHCCSSGHTYAWENLGLLFGPCWSAWGLPKCPLGPSAWPFPTLKSHHYLSVLIPQRKAWGAWAQVSILISRSLQKPLPCSDSLCLCPGWVIVLSSPSQSYTPCLLFSSQWLLSLLGF